MKRSILIILSCLYAFTLSAIEGLRFESITNKNGLSHNTVRCIMQDSRGFMWFSTINGLNRYDGYKFVNMHPEYGTPSLTENNIRRTVEDPNGRIWIHTTSWVVNCYDTHTESFVDYLGKNEVRSYKKIEVMPDGDVWLCGTDNGACHVQNINGDTSSNLYDINTMGTNVVHFVLEDSSKKIWLGTDKGLVQIINNVPKFSNTGDRTYNFTSAVELKDSIYFFANDDRILIFDKSKQIFLPEIQIPQGKKRVINQTAALDDSKILIAGKQTTQIFDASSSKFINSSSFFNGETLKETNILTDNKGNHWVYNKSGNIWRYKKEIQQFEKFNLIPRSILPVIDLERYDIYCDSRGIAWITTFGNGLFTIEDNGQINHFTTANSGLKANYLLSISEDRTGNIWIGTEYTGIAKVSLTRYNNQVFFPDPNKTGDSDRIIRSLYEDEENGDIWMGTKAGDLYVLDKELKRKQTYTLPKGIPYCITTDSIGNKWIGTKGNGLIIIPKGKTSLNNSLSYSLIDNNDTGADNIYTILRDQKGRMWIGTFGEGLFLCEQADRKLHTTHFPHISNKQKQIRCMIQDHSGKIWVGGENGIVVFEPDSLLKSNISFDWYHFDKNNPQSLNNNIVKALFEDSEQRIWIGTSGGGLSLVTKNKQDDSVNFTHYTSEEGLSNNVVQAILEDNKQNLWISTESGISKFNSKELHFENYNFLDTWESDLFCESSSFKKKNGELLFGSYNGMYVFNPELFDNQQPVLPVIITGLHINGIPVTPNSSDSPLIQSIIKTQSIKLKHRQNSFSVEFSTLNFQNLYSNRYTYILENYDKDWNPITQYNVATYKNIPAGNYTFKVKSRNSLGNWDDLETELSITIVPPFYKSTEAFILYFILSILITFFTIRLIIKMNKLHNEVEVEKQLTEYRLRFFTNISHEFRTPLTIIQGCIEGINSIKSTPPALRKYIKTLDKSSSKLMRLIDQLLEFRKMQNEKMELRLEHTEVVNHLRNIYDMFTETAERKKINFSFSSDEESKVILLDKGKIEKVLFNLLSNAFKHTPEEGSIAVSLTFNHTPSYLEVSVSDSGIGIPPEKRDQLFIRFKQINYSSSGIGIGLHLTSELVNLHKGKIEYSDSKWEGACFTVSIPTVSDVYDPKDIVDSHSTIPVQLTPKDNEIQEGAEETDTEKQQSNNKYKILIIEDDEEISLFLEDQLQGFFSIVTASNGLIGLEKAIQEQPSLVVCDVMMPEMDGFEVTRRLKGDFESSHIPIILLTAHSSMEHKLEGINAGADAYITKPFSTKYLISRIIKLIEQREKLQHKFAHEPSLIQTTICTTDKDNAFIEKIHVIIEEHLDDSEFSIDDFAQAAHMGRTLFYKKIKGITNYSPNEYLRIVRLKKAAELLKATDFNISEIAYKVGFNDPFYFSKCFKEQFGMRPTQFRNKNIDKTD